MLKVCELMQCFDKIKQIKNDVFVNAEVSIFSNCDMKINLQSL